MITDDGKWIPEGLDREDPKRIRTTKQLTDWIEEIGFLPMFSNGVKGFSMEEHVGREYWWSGNALEDPWEWRAVLAREGIVAYGKIFAGKAGFISKKWYPYLSCYRRDGFDFDSRYEDGQASRKEKLIMDIMDKYDSLPSYVIKEMSGFHKFGEKGFDGVMNKLQMQTYLTVRDFRPKTNRKGEEYGWSVGHYTKPELLFGEDLIRSAYSITPAKAKEKLCSHIAKLYPNADTKVINTLIK